MVDTERLLDAIRKFKRSSTLAVTDNSKPCTVGDYNRLVANLAALLKTIVEESEKQ